MYCGIYVKIYILYKNYHKNLRFLFKAICRDHLLVSVPWVGTLGLFFNYNEGAFINDSVRIVKYGNISYSQTLKDLKGHV